MASRAPRPWCPLVAEAPIPGPKGGEPLSVNAAVSIAGGRRPGQGRAGRLRATDRRQRFPPLLLLFLAGGRFRDDLPEPGQVFRLHLGGGAVLAPDRVVHLLAVHADLLGGVDPQTHLVTADVYHG